MSWLAKRLKTSIKDRFFVHKRENMKKYLLGAAVLMTFSWSMAFGADTPGVSNAAPAPAEDADFVKGYELYNQQKYDEAIPFLQKTLAKNPSHLRGQVYLGVSYMGKEDFQSAIVELEKALEMDEKYPLTNYALSVSYSRKTPPDIGKAEKFLASAKQYGYQVPIWFEQYVERLKSGKVEQN
jgi:tetratricopeptide (TPR) repeat protein